MASFMGKSDLRDFLGNLLAIVDKCNHSCIKVFLFTITKCCSSLTNPTSSSTLKMTKQKVLCKYQSVLSHNYFKSLIQRNYSENSTPIKYQVSFLCKNILIIIFTCENICNMLYSHLKRSEFLRLNNKLCFLQQKTTASKINWNGFVFSYWCLLQ